MLGAGHSAIGTLIDLTRLKDQAPATKIIWLLRGDKPEKAFGGGANDKLGGARRPGRGVRDPRRGRKIRVETGFRLAEYRDRRHGLRLSTGPACAAVR